LLRRKSKEYTGKNQFSDDWFIARKFMLCFLAIGKRAEKTKADNKVALI
jgi:hypothetical protein